ncbi:MAG TPA: peptidoglycan-binding domain-containing protein [Oleiagrimonas sp.]|nr:peptidoglycan-binding domain-containing protein [Oleiagrimonas sp.]
MARSHAGIRVQVGPASDKIETFLKTEHPNDIAKAIPSLVLEDLTCDDGGRVTARYRGKASLAQQDVTLHDWQWTLSSMGTDAYVFSKPSVFDDLLASELAAIRRRRDKKGDFRVTRGMALRIFREYRNIPALKRAMHDLAFAKTDGEAFHQDRVKRAAQGYISDAATADLTDAIVAILPKLSAHRSMAVWLLIMGVLGIVAFRFAAAMVPVSAAWDTISPGDAGALVAQGVVLAMGSCIAVLLATPLALLLSRIISKAQSLRLPKHYREKKRRSWKPAGRFVLVMPLVVALGISYSLSAGRFHLPPIQSALYEALPELMAFNTGPATPERDFVDDSIDRSTVYRRIQTYLNGHGYAVGAVDGIAGKRTRAQLRAYLHDHGLSESLSPDQIARYMQENP